MASLKNYNLTIKFPSNTGHKPIGIELCTYTFNSRMNPFKWSKCILEIMHKFVKF